jgi:hypothetical protein
MSQSVRSNFRRATSRTPAPATREVAPGRIPPRKVGDIVEILPLV